MQSRWRKPLEACGSQIIPLSPTDANMAVVAVVAVFLL